MVICRENPPWIKLSANGTGEGWPSTFSNLALKLQDWFFYDFSSRTKQLWHKQFLTTLLQGKRNPSIFNIGCSLFILERAALWSKAVRRPFCFCTRNIGDSSLPRHMHIPRKGTTFPFIYRGTVFAFKPAQAMPFAPEFYFFFPLIPGSKASGKICQWPATNQNIL